MERLLNFVYQYRALFTFLVLEIFCAWLIVEGRLYAPPVINNAEAHKRRKNIVPFVFESKNMSSKQRYNWRI